MKKAIFIGCVIVLLLVTGCSFRSEPKIDHALVASLSHDNTKITTSGIISLNISENFILNDFEKEFISNNSNIPFYLEFYKNNNKEISSQISVQINEHRYDFRMFEDEYNQLIGDENGWIPTEFDVLKFLHTFLFNTEEQKNKLIGIFSKEKIEHLGEIELQEGNNTFSTHGYAVQLSEEKINSFFNENSKFKELSNLDFNVKNMHFKFFKEDNFIRAVYYEIEIYRENDFSIQLTGNAVFNFYDSNPSFIKKPKQEELYPSLSKFYEAIIRRL